MFLRQSWYKGWYKGPVRTAWPPTQGTITSYNGWDSRTNPPTPTNVTPPRHIAHLTHPVRTSPFCLIHWLPDIVTCVLTLTFQVSGILTRLPWNKVCSSLYFLTIIIFFSWLNTAKMSCMRHNLSCKLNHINLCANVPFLTFNNSLHHLIGYTCIIL